MNIQLPGLIDPHVHTREPGATHKEDWDSVTAAAIAGGFTQILAMPNTQPPITSLKLLENVLKAARTKARCDYAQYLGAGGDNASDLPPLAERAAGLKMYLDLTYGPLRLDNMTLWMEHFMRWPAPWPVVAHAEGRTLAAAVLMAGIYSRPLHLAHVSRREEILLIRAAKEKGIPVTCEVTPHHLFLTNEDMTGGRSDVRPPLASASDRAALWANLDVIDCFATDHAPHTATEKDGPNPPPGFPGLETALSLFLTAVHQDRLTLDDLVARMVTNPRRIFHLPRQAETRIEFDPNAIWEVRAEHLYSRCGWTPFEGWRLHGRLRRVVLRGEEAFRDGQVLAPPGSGKNLRGDSGEAGQTMDKKGISHEIFF